MLHKGRIFGFNLKWFSGQPRKSFSLCGEVCSTWWAEAAVFLQFPVYCTLCSETSRKLLAFSQTRKKYREKSYVILLPFQEIYPYWRKCQTFQTLDLILSCMQSITDTHTRTWSKIMLTVSLYADWVVFGKFYRTVSYSQSLQYKC